MTEAKGARSLPGAGAEKSNRSYLQGTPGCEERDRVLAALRRNGHVPYTNSDTGWMYFASCPTHVNSPVRISTGRDLEMECLAQARGVGAQGCGRDEVIRAFGLMEIIPTEVSTLDRLRAALVDSAGLDDIAEPVPLVKGVLQLDSLAWLQGKPGHGKSFIALDLAGCVGTGQMWQGFPVTPGPVLYLAAEGVSGVRQRVRAWEHSMGMDMKGVHFLPVAVQSTSGIEWTAFKELAAGLKPSLVILDTQARVTVGAEENSAKDMGEFVHRVEQLRQATGACVLVVHHEGRAGEHMRGSTAIEGAATSILRAKKDGENIDLECVKQKDLAPFEKIELRLVPTQMSVVVCLSGPMRQSSVLTGQEEKLVSLWRETFETDAVSVSNLVETLEMPKATVSRAVKKLVRLHLATQRGSETRPLYQLN